MKSEKTKAMALAICIVMIVSILTAFVSIPVLAAGNVDKTQTCKNPVLEYTQAEFTNYPAPLQKAFMPTELKRLPKSSEEFKKIIEERHEQRFQEMKRERPKSIEDFEKIMENHVVKLQTIDLL